MLLLNEYHEDISKLHVNMMQRRSYYVPFVDTNEAITIKDRNKQNNFFLLNGKWQFRYFNTLQSIKEFENIPDISIENGETLEEAVAAARALQTGGMPPSAAAKQAAAGTPFSKGQIYKELIK